MILVIADRILTYNLWRIFKILLGRKKKKKKKGNARDKDLDKAREEKEGKTR
jgi:hypothetical protein